MQNVGVIAYREEPTYDSHQLSSEHNSVIVLISQLATLLYSSLLYQCRFQQQQQFSANKL